MTSLPSLDEKPPVSATSNQSLHSHHSQHHSHDHHSHDHSQHRHHGHHHHHSHGHQSSSSSSLTPMQSAHPSASSFSSSSASARESPSLQDVALHMPHHDHHHHDHHSHHHDHHHSYSNDKDKKGHPSHWQSPSYYIRRIVQDRQTRNIFFYLLLNLTFMLVEVLYGWWSNSLGLLGDGLHMFFDSTALILSLLASVVAKWEANRSFSYGYGRVEILAGFVNCMALFFAAGGIVMEAIERLLDPPAIKTERLLLVAVLGLCVNLVGIFAFDHGGHHHHGHGHGHGHDHHGHGHDHHEHHHGDHGNVLMDGMFLHVLADTLGSVGVITSSLLIQYFGWVYADPICSLFIAALIFVSVWPLWKHSALVLMQRTPHQAEAILSRLQTKIQGIPGLLYLNDVHFWEQTTESWAGTVKVQVRKEVEEQAVRMHVWSIVSQELPQVRWMTIQVDKDVVVGM